MQISSSVHALQGCALHVHLQSCFIGTPALSWLISVVSLIKDLGEHGKVR